MALLGARNQPPGSASRVVAGTADEGRWTPIGMRGEMARTPISTGATVPPAGIRVVAHGAKWCRSQPAGKKAIPVAPGSASSVFEEHFGLFACGVVLVWVFLRVFDFTLLPPAYNGLVIAQPFHGLHSWDAADHAWAARSHLQYGLDYTKGFPTLQDRSYRESLRQVKYRFVPGVY